MGNHKNIFLILSLIFFALIILKKRNFSDYDLNTIKVSIPIREENLAINAFTDFDDYFDLVYIDSTDYFNLQNVLKLVSLNDFQVKIKHLQSNNFNSLFNNFYDNFMIDEYKVNEMYLSSVERFLNMLDFLLNNEIVYDNIGDDLFFSLLVDYKRIGTFNESQIILNLKPDLSYADLFEVLNQFDKKNFPINYLELNDKDIYNYFINQMNSNISFEIFLNEHYWAYSDDLNHLENTVAKLSSEEVNSVLMYINNETKIKGDRYKKIRNFSISGIDDSNKEYLSLESSYQILENSIYMLKQIDKNVADYKTNQLINKLLSSINKILLTLKNKNLEVRYFYLQDCFYKSYNKLNNYFIDLSPITIDYLNSSIKNKYYNSKNNMYISKIFVKEDNYKKKKYIDKIFKNKTNLLR